jgi:hypothetical protein
MDSDSHRDSQEAVPSAPVKPADAPKVAVKEVKTSGAQTVTPMIPDARDGVNMKVIEDMLPSVDDCSHFAMADRMDDHPFLADKPIQTTTKYLDFDWFTLTT